MVEPKEEDASVFALRDAVFARINSASIDGQQLKDFITFYYHVPWSPGASYSQALSRVLIDPSLTPSFGTEIIPSDAVSHDNTATPTQSVPITVVAHVLDACRLLLVLTNTQDMTIKIEACYMVEACLVDKMSPFTLYAGDEYGLLFKLKPFLNLTRKRLLPMKMEATLKKDSYDAAENQAVTHKAIVLPFFVRWRPASSEMESYRWSLHTVNVKVCLPLAQTVTADEIPLIV